MKKVIGTTLAILGLVGCTCEAGSIALQVIVTGSAMLLLVTGAAMLGAFKEDKEQTI